MKKFALISGIAALVIVLGFSSLIALRWVIWKPARNMESAARSMIGHSETELVSALGEPEHVVLAATLDGRTVDYPWKGMNYMPVPDRPVVNKVLLYSKLDTAIYVYIDQKGMVEYVVTAYT